MVSFAGLLLFALGGNDKTLFAVGGGGRALRSCWPFVTRALQAHCLLACYCRSSLCQTSIAIRHADAYLWLLRICWMAMQVRSSLLDEMLPESLDDSEEALVLPSGECAGGANSMRC